MHLTKSKYTYARYYHINIGEQNTTRDQENIPQ